VISVIHLISILIGFHLY